MSSAAERLAQLDALPAGELCGRALRTLDALVDVMNRETVLLRSGRVKDATQLSADKTRLAQDYMGLARSVQRQAARLKAEAPVDVARLRSGHEKLATQMAENLRVLATARAVTEDILTDVAVAVGASQRTQTYGAGGVVGTAPARAAAGVAINRAL